MLTRKRWALSGGVLIAALVCASIAYSLVMTSPTGKWPPNWPREMEGLRSHARTIDIATGLQQKIYEITFPDRETFERAWPAIRSLKTPGAPLTLYKAKSEPPKSWGSLLSNAAPAVRIYAPVGESVATRAAADGDKDLDTLIAEGKAIRFSPPWPASIALPNGALPEYVTIQKQPDGTSKVIDAATMGEQQGRRYRARIDLDLVVDGTIIDLNRIPLPGDTPITDKRFE